MEMARPHGVEQRAVKEQREIAQEAFWAREPRKYQVGHPAEGGFSNSGICKCPRVPAKERDRTLYSPPRFAVC